MTRRSSSSTGCRSSSYADVDGRAAAVFDPAKGRAVTAVDIAGEQRALLVHDASLLEEPALLQAATAAARVALQNARLQIEPRRAWRSCAARGADRRGGAEGMAAC